MVNPYVRTVSSETLHAACVTIGDRAVLIAGDTAEARTELALRLIDRGAMLVADTHTLCLRDGQALLASPVQGEAGRIDVPGLGMVDMPHRERVAVALMICLLDPDRALPDATPLRRIAGCDVPVIELPGDAATTPFKIELALGRLRP